jgi:hypothetical protein
MLRKDVMDVGVAGGKNEGTTQPAADDVNFVVYGTHGRMVARGRHRCSLGPSVGLRIVFFHGVDGPMGACRVKSGLARSRMFGISRLVPKFLSGDKLAGTLASYHF